MRTVSTETTDAWKASFKGGPRKAVMRATISRLDVNLFNYDYALKRALEDRTTRKGSGQYASALFGQTDQPVELPNVQSIRWSRSVDTDAATCTLKLLNSEVVPLGELVTGADEVGFDRPGYFTYNRGASSDGQALWGYETNGWLDLIVPDRVIRTYEGYGVNYAQVPEDDTHMHLSGVWLIDDVVFSTDGTISIECRDMARLLIDQICYPPVVPWAEYPLYFSRYHEVDNPDIISTNTAQNWIRPAYQTDSNIPYVGRGIKDGNIDYVDANGAVLGHHGSHAFDADDGTWWISVGNYPSWSSAFEYVQGGLGGQTISGVRVRTWGGPYTCYVSLYANGAWQGASTIPYRSRMVDTNADIRFVTAFTAAAGDWTYWGFPPIAGVTAVRLTFTNLFDSGIGTYRWRAGVHAVDVLATSSYTTVTDGGTHWEGNYTDYTDVVKQLLAYGGFYWPASSTGQHFMTETDGDLAYLTAAGDPCLPEGRIWGDFEQTGTNGYVDLTAEIFDKKPLMDGISYVRDIIGFVFFIDESGGAVWRNPNIWSVGNWVWAADGGPHTGRTSTLVVIDEKETLTQMSAKISSRSMREKVFVANTSGKIGAVAAGFVPHPSGLRRVGGWTDQNFETTEECQVMADLITLRQAFNFRTNQITIPGYPAIQVDDQVRIRERITGETYIHYVREITSEWSASTGEWTYSLVTNWLGETPFTRWAFDPAQLSAETRAYLETVGAI